MKDISKSYDKYDLFAQDIPSFHIEGHKKIGSCIGCYLTVLLTILVVGYSGVRMRYLIIGDRPNISSFTIQDERDDTELIDLNQHQFKVAFTVDTISANDDYIPANDPDFVEWNAEFNDFDNRNVNKITLSIHKCTDEDFSEFHEILAG